MYMIFAMLFLEVYVQMLVNDSFPFEHKIYSRIARSFPFLTDLTIFDIIRRYNRPSHEANKNNETPSVIVFPHITHLTIYYGNIDNAEQLLVDTNALLPRLTDLTIPLLYIEQVTKNFTREATRRNCANIKRLDFNRSLAHCEDFYLYFPCYK